jgi:hypothetical protein
MQEFQSERKVEFRLSRPQKQIIDIEAQNKKSEECTKWARRATEKPKVEYQTSNQKTKIKREPIH